MGLLSCPLPCQVKNHEQDLDHQSHHSSSSSRSDGGVNSDSSSSNTSLSSQISLPAVHSLTPPSHLVEQSSTAYHHHIATLKGHSSYIFSLALGGKHLYSGSSNGEIRRWSRDPSIFQAEKSTANVIAEDKSGVKSMLVVGNQLFTAHHDHKIRVWKISEETEPNQKFKCIATLPTMNDRCMKFFQGKNYVEVRRHKKMTWVHHVDTVSALALSKDGSLLYSASWDRTFKVWRTSDFKCLESVWNAHDDAINAIILSHDSFVYTGSADKKIKVWKKRGGDKKHSLVATLEKHKSAVNALALSPDGSVLYSGACDRSIIVWEKDGGSGHMAVAGALRGHTKAILCLTVVEENLVCSGSADKTVRVWRRGIGRSYSCLAVLQGHGGPIKCLAAASENNESSSGTSVVVYSGSLDCDVKIWKIWVPCVSV